MKKLLLFDDDYRNVKLIKRKCKGYFEIVWVKNETELDEEIDAEFDVIVTDVRIKGTDKKGHVIVDDIRMGFGFSGINVIVYSGVANISEIKKAYEGLFFDCIDKGDGEWTTILLKVCISASEEKKSITSHRYLKNKLKKLGKDKELLEGFDTVGKEIGKNGKPETLGDLVDLLLNDIEEDVREYLEKFVLDLIKRFDTQNKLAYLS